MAANAEQLARGLGWFSIGLGVAQIAAPRSMAQLIGVRDDEDNCLLLQAIGVREIVSGLGILSRDQPARWLWSRVGGDAMDLTLLSVAMASPYARQDRVTATTAAVAGITALDAYCGQQLSGPVAIGQRASKDRAIHVTRTIAINRPPEDLYRFWRDFENLPRFMNHIEEVRVIDNRRSHWRAKGPAGMTIEWDAEVTEDKPNERIAWRSLDGADVDNSGSVQFKRGPGGRGTEVRVEIHYAPPGGRLGATIARLFGEDPGQQVREELRAFKQLMETGEIPRSEASFGWLAHPARPPKEVARR